MSKGYFKQDNPVQFPTEDGKTILEHFGAASTGQTDVSIARMIAPPGWSEPWQVPDFDEYTMMVRGKKLIQTDNEEIILHPGESIQINKGTRVRYSNPFSEDADYWSTCIPAFSPESVHRES